MNLDDDIPPSDNVVDRRDEISDPINDMGSVFRSGGSLSIGDAYTQISNWLKSKTDGSDDGGAIPNTDDTDPDPDTGSTPDAGSSGQYAAGGPVMGFDPEHRVVKRDPPVGHYDDGGAVPTPDDTDPNTDQDTDPDTGSTPDVGTPADTSMGGDNTMGAVHAALNYGRQKYNISDSGVPGPDQGSGIRPYLSGEGASHPDEVTAAEQAVNPDGQMSPKDAHMDMLGQLEPEDAFSVLQHDRVQHRGFAAHATAALDQGDADKAARSATEAMASVPSRWDILVRALFGGPKSPEDMAALKERSFGGVRDQMQSAAGEIKEAGGVAKAAGKAIIDDATNPENFKKAGSGSGEEAPAAPPTKETSTPVPQQPDAKTTASEAAPAAQGPAQGIPDQPSPASPQQTLSKPRQVANVTDAAGVSHPQFAVDLIDSKTGKVTQTESLTSDQLKQLMKVDFDTHASQGAAAVLKGITAPQTQPEGITAPQTQPVGNSANVRDVATINQSGARQPGTGGTIKGGTLQNGNNLSQGKPLTAQQGAERAGDQAADKRVQARPPGVYKDNLGNTVYVKFGEKDILGLPAGDRRLPLRSVYDPSTDSPKAKAAAQVQTNKLDIAKVQAGRTTTTQDRIDARSQANADRIDARSQANATNRGQAAGVRDQQVTEREARTNAQRSSDSLRRQLAANPMVPDEKKPGEFRQVTPQEIEQRAQQQYDQAYRNFKGQAAPASQGAPTQPVAGAGGAKQAYFKGGQWFDVTTHKPVQ